MPLFHSSSLWVILLIHPFPGAHVELIVVGILLAKLGPIYRL